MLSLGRSPRLFSGAAVLCLYAVGLACSTSAPIRPRPGKTAASPPTVTISVVADPLLVAPHFTPSGERYELLLRLNVSNGTPRPVTVERVSLVSEQRGTDLSTVHIDPPLLRQRLRALPWIVVRNRQTFAAAHRWHMALLRPKGNTILPARGGVSLAHRFSIQHATALPDRLRCSVVYEGGVAQITVNVQRYQQRTPLRLPFSGRWQVLAGHRFGEPHSRLGLLSQSFAYDFGVLGPRGSTHSGNPRAAESFFAHGQPILAAAPGVVVATRDGMVESSPRTSQRSGWQRWLTRPRDLAGNYVVLRHGAAESSEFSAYLHLRPGLSVTPGQHVKAGTPLGLCGNSGNSAQPHLHFQLQDGPDPLTARGLPARFFDFSVHYGHLTIYVPMDKPATLPNRVTLQPGGTDGSVDLRKLSPGR